MILFEIKRGSRVLGLASVFIWWKPIGLYLYLLNNQSILFIFILDKEYGPAKDIYSNEDCADAQMSDCVIQ